MVVGYKLFYKSTKKDKFAAAQSSLSVSPIVPLTGEHN